MEWLGDAVAVWIVIAIWGLYFWWADWEDKQRRTRPDRIRRQMRDLEHDIIIKMGREDILRAMLLEDLRQIAACHRAVEWARENYGIEIEWPPTTTTTSSCWPKTGWFTSVKRAGRWRAP